MVILVEVELAETFPTLGREAVRRKQARKLPGFIRGWF